MVGQWGEDGWVTGWSWQGNGVRTIGRRGEDGREKGVRMAG